MAQTSPDQVVVSCEQRRELERRAAAYSGPYRAVVRAKAILLVAEGLSNTEIAERLAQSRQAVSTWRKRFCEEGLQGLEERPRPERPRRFPPTQVAEVKALRASCPRSRAFRSRAGRPLSWRAKRSDRDRRDDRGDHDLSVAARGRDPPVELPFVDLPARPKLLPKSGPDPRPSTRVAGKGSCLSPAISSCARMRSRRSKPEHASTRASPPRLAGMGSWSSTSTNEGCALLPGGLGRAARQAV
jgi:transposase